ncbi:unnamed protein product [Sphenostylis stenocarpa]|uniref:SKP1-like protein n=1 Tax=Sphenostylis stenocarpa TaxID=92480 RepID=A0AA86SI24_9FABA|nr:unnamed protein product [Sphenostylis stenocarpa]
MTAMAEEAESSTTPKLKATNESMEKLPTEELEKLTIASEEEKIKLKCADGITMEVKSSIVKEMLTVQSFVDELGVDAVIPLHNVTSAEVECMVEYWSGRHPLGCNNKAVREFNENFVKKLSLNEMKELLLAANYLNMNSFFEVISKGIADAIKNQTVEFAREFFGIESDYTPEEEAAYREANSWAFENIDQDGRLGV